MPLRRGLSSSVSVGVTYRQDRNLCYTWLPWWAAVTVVARLLPTDTGVPQLRDTAG